MLLKDLPRQIKLKHLVFLLISIPLLIYFGAFTHILEVNFESEFEYPLQGDIKYYVDQLKNHEKPDISPINVYNFSFIYNSDHKCKNDDGFEKLRLVYIVKSAVDHFGRRLAIRNSWGFEKRFSDVPIRTVFVLGVIPDDKELQSKVDAEQKKYNDIVQAQFVDSYFNNTYKTMMGIKWSVLFCPNSKFYFFSDDDMYVSTKNVLRFVRNPTHYPEYLEVPVSILKQQTRKKRDTSFGLETNSLNNKVIHSRKLQQVLDFELADDVKLFTGYVFVSSPHRHRSSKWYVSLEEYPFDMWPPYVTAGAYILSREALVDMYYASHYTKHFRFDDIYLGLVAKKIGLEPFHCDEFHFYKKPYNVFSYHYVIASHGYEDSNELLKVWNEQRSAGNA